MPSATRLWNHDKLNIQLSDFQNNGWLLAINTWLHGVHTYSSITIINLDKKLGSETATALCLVLVQNKKPPSMNTYSFEAHPISKSHDDAWSSILSINLTFPNHAATQITAGRSILSTGVRLSCSTICIHNRDSLHVIGYLTMGLINQPFSLSRYKA